jgi:ribosome-binding factor A
VANPRTIARLEARIKERAAYCLQFEVKDPRAGFITITRVELSSDITSGKIHYSVMGGESEKSKAQHMLEHAAGFIQRQVASVLQVRRMPRLSWFYDDSVERAADLAKLIHEARTRDMDINPALRDEPPVVPAMPDDSEGDLPDMAEDPFGDDFEEGFEDDEVEDEDSRILDEGPGPR